MYADVVDLREFYQSAIGQMVRRLLRARLRSFWPDLRNERVLALGYGVPLLRPLLSEAGSVIAMMPAAQGVAYWPREGRNLSCLASTEDLPLADSSIDRVILLHALEGSADSRGMLREAWRVLRGGGRLLVIVPNRRGLWAHSDRTPFGTGRPYSAFQIKDTLRDEGFMTDRIWQTLYAPPWASRLTLSLADIIEKYGEKLFPGFGGLLMAEAGKQVYAPLLAKSRAAPHRVILPLPAPAALPIG
ncbi:MAG: methyltransferase domain-containing protein [Pseudomonadota bacterium]|nr:methyltransferase domain-containing protein [Pseudomonadota bacterium]